MIFNFSKRKASSIIAICFIFALCVPFSGFAANETAQDDTQAVQSQEIDISKIDIDGLSKKNKVNPDELRAAIEKASKSPVFSPFSAVKVHDGIEASSSESTPVTVNQKTGVTAKTTYTKTNQNSTAYLATGNPTASGVTPAVGMCAVHHYPKAQGYKPYIPFGTDIKYTKSVTIQGRSYVVFDVQDTGDPNFVMSTYWTDLFFGANTKANRTAALNYGNRRVTYSYTL